MKSHHQIYIHDNLEVMRNLPEQSVDLIYLDPPFNSKRMYEAPIGTKSEGAKFHDVWRMSDVKDHWFGELSEQYPALGEFIASVIIMQGKLAKNRSDLAAYLIFMGIRLAEMKWLLKDSGSIYLHCDPTAGHYLKIMMDYVFGAKNFCNEIVWSYKSGGASMKTFAKKHDVIFYYAKNAKNVAFFPMKEKSYNRGLKPYQFKDVEEYEDETGWYTLVNMKDVWTIDMVGRTSKERTGYPTQKPVALLERIIQASSRGGDLVLDPFCGCATTNVVSAMLGRNSIGVDVSRLAGKLIHDRLQSYKDRHPLVTLNETVKVEYKCPAVPRSRRRPRVVLDYAKPKGPAQREYATAAEKKAARRADWSARNGICPGCREFVHFRFTELDRRVPGAEGGKYTPDNTRFLCTDCNRNKKDEYLSDDALYQNYLKRKRAEQEADRRASSAAG
ncbi:MAG: DNA methyltransferase [Gammaproteobacteria bacterium]|nr:DNA methyltransferase [Gammaproteobacteria bacterium]